MLHYRVLEVAYLELSLLKSRRAPRETKKEDGALSTYKFIWIHYTEEGEIVYNKLITVIFFYISICTHQTPNIVWRI